jgi:hypothetical protein
MRNIFSLVIVLVTAVSIAKAQHIPKDWEVSLERTGCLGSCPAYKAMITANGSVTFRDRDGETETGKLSPSEVRQLFDLSESKLFFRQRSEYKPEQDCDGPYETDWPSESISITSDGRSRVITHNQGCRVRPNSFLSKVVKLAEEIDRLTNGMFIKR